MRISKLPLIVGFPLVLGACATAIPGVYTEPKAGFANIASQITPAIGKRTVFAETQAENEALKKQVHGMVHRKTISADTAVQVALLNNKGLQASYANVGLSAADAWQESTPENPVVSIGILIRAMTALSALVTVSSRSSGLSLTSTSQRPSLASSAAWAGTMRRRVAIVSASPLANTRTRSFDQFAAAARRGERTGCPDPHRRPHRHHRQLSRVQVQPWRPVSPRG